jgi:hypothetical protein
MPLKSMPFYSREKQTNKVNEFDRTYFFFKYALKLTLQATVGLPPARKKEPTDIKTDKWTK